MNSSLSGSGEFGFLGQAAVMDIDFLSTSIVGLRAVIPEDAFTATGLGTLREGNGVVIRDDGLVLTIGYLITEAEEVWLTRQDGTVVAAHPLAYDQESGFGLVQALAPLNLPALPIGNSATAGVNDPVTVIDGNRRFIRSRIAARQEFAGYWEYLIQDAIFTAPAHPSWGGAAVIDAKGRLIGIGSLLLQMDEAGNMLDMNMVVPIDLLAPIINDLLSHGRVNKPPRPWLGAFAAETNGRVVVMSVAEGAPAAQAGLRRGDVIAEIRDGEVEGLADFYRKVWSSGSAGAEIPMRVLRDGRDAWLRVKTADRNSFLRKPQLQ
jgi:S1-C subfamily serine protease